MDNEVDKAESKSFLKKLPFIAIAVLLLLLVLVMNQVPPSGQWVHDSSVPVFPTLKYTHINDPFGVGYREEMNRTGLSRANNYSEDKEDVALEEQSSIAPRFFNPVEAPDSPRFYPPSETQFSNATAATNQSLSVSKTAYNDEDLLKPNYMHNGQDDYMQAFGISSEASK